MSKPRSPDEENCEIANVVRNSEYGDTQYRPGRWIEPAVELD